ncbi:hypothetical protein NQ314_008863, partial [Rhamnusium bicolor]
IPAEERPQFNTELVWEVEKKDLRKFRSANQPLRVECVNTDLHNRKERVGFTLLSLRSAQIIPLKIANQEVHPKWHKLIGCQTGKKKFQPEIFLSLTVRDHLLNEAETSSSIEAEAMPYISEEDSNVADIMLSSLFPVTYLEDGFIQIGDDENAVSAFSLNLFIDEVVNLDTLLPEILVFQKNDEKTPQRYNFKRKKIVVKLLSSQAILEEFFMTQSITINFYCVKDKLGTTDIDLANVFTKKELICYFKFPSENGMIPFGACEKSPSIKIQVWLEQHKEEVIEKIENFEDIVEKDEEKSKARTVFSNVPKPPTSSGDQGSGSYVLDKLEKISEKAQSDSEPPKKEPAVTPFITKSVETVVKNVPLSPKQGNPLDVYQNYITIFSEVDNSLGENIYLNNLDVKIVYISTPDKAKNLLNAWPPRLVLMDEKEKSLSEEYEFITVVPSNSSTEQDVVLKVARTLEPLAKLGIYLNLIEANLEDVEDNANLIIYPATNGKKKKKNRFDAEIDNIKTKELRKLQQEWDQKKNKMEEQLSKNINKCKKLQECLQNKMNLLKTEKCLIRKRNSSNIYEDIFKENWANYNNENTREVIELLSKTQRDNENLREIVSEQKQALENIAKSTLTKSQTANLLQELRVLEEKFEDAQNAKCYFKEQWKKACEEIHDIKREDIMTMQTQIQQNKEELSQLSLDQFVGFQNGVAKEIYGPESVRSGNFSF